MKKIGREMDDPSARPAISGKVDNMDQYDIVIIGHPIWHGQAPRIISTFLESYDFSSKTSVTFCTSHSGGPGSSAENLHSLVPDNVNWLESADSRRERLKMRYRSGWMISDFYRKRNQKRVYLILKQNPYC